MLVPLSLFSQNIASKKIYLSGNHGKLTLALIFETF